MSTVEIKVNNIILGTVDTDELTGKAVLALDRARRFDDMIDWIVTYAGGNADQVEDVLSAMKARDLHQFAESIGEALSAATEPPKANGRRSSRR